MLCQHCNQAEATVSLHLRVNGQQKHLRLCPSCAGRLEREYLGRFHDLFAPSLPGFFKTGPGGLFAGAPAGGIPAPEAPAAPSAGVIPEAIDLELSRRREENALRARLAEAVRAERYEEAGRLRDEIARLDGRPIDTL